MQELNVPSELACSSAHNLFLERLDAFCLAEIKAFAEREHRSLDETRQYVAEWHCKHLFQPTETSASPQDRKARVPSVLSDASRILESLCDASGVQSFLLAVDPADPTGSGFLGGSLLGREFWRGLRGGGDAGAKAFKLHCFKSGARTPIPSMTEASSSKLAPPPAVNKVAPARTLKADLYDGVRKALRSASGVHNAEMKWTNPALLATYGVCLVGWPSAIPAQNPSSLKANQNKELLEALESGTMHFVRTLKTRIEPEVEPELLRPAPDEDNNFSWAIQFDVNDSPTAPDLNSTVSDNRDVSDSYFPVWDSGRSTPKRKRAEDDV
ncbi:hypothetical protein C8R45DRAFT_962897 [Mycena sanguinolenta]|nr:hypothetical protein C8R45DRAFT_962897 [Mycena sanguinolenta]